jgi:hypothetical protein
MIIAGTGTRSIVTSVAAMGWIIDTLVSMIRSRDESVDLTLISGMAEGFDEALARAAIQCQIPFQAFVPHPTYGRYYWGQHSLTGVDRLAEFDELLAQASEIVTTASTLYVSGIHANFVRNIRMVDAADKMWCYGPTSRGTAHCIQYARRIGRPVYMLPMFPSEITE